ncbi:MAG: TonB-dependent receptor [Pseudomonadota bacterium]
MSTSGQASITRADFRKVIRSVLLGGVSTLAMGAMAAPAFAQAAAPAPEATDSDTIVVTGIRGSLQHAMDIKRNSVGVVEAITAEDIGKMPDTNLAESLQRVSGLSIDRVNGEGSRVTARGFGPGFNLVTLNGRAMPTADVNIIGGGADAEYGTFTSRAFDFSNLASEGVAALEVYKTGRASIPSGGIGATIDIHTFRPFDNPGTRATISVKALNDTSVVNGDEITPEVSGLASWTSADGMFGVSLFGSFQERDSASVGADGNNWNLDHGSDFLNPANGRVSPTTTITNPPSATQLVSFPNNSEYFFNEDTRKRTNGQLTVQFRPTDTLTLTGDVFYAKNDTEEQRATQGNWFNRPFSTVILDGDPQVATTVFLAETLSAPKDVAWGNEQRAQEDITQSIGFNAAWNATDALTVTFDAHTSKAESNPNGPNGISSYDMGTGAAVVASQTLDIRSGFPIQHTVFDDSHLGNGNAHNGQLDILDVSSSVGRTSIQRQTQDLDQYRLFASYDFGNDWKLNAGVERRNSSMHQRRLVTAQILGDWGVTQPGDLQARSPGTVQSYCMSCLFHDFSPGSPYQSGINNIAFRGNAATLYQAMSPYYLGVDATNSTSLHQIQTWNNDDNTVDEDITAFYAETAWDGDLNGHHSTLVAGLRYEKTDVQSSSIQAVPNAIKWNSDNDFSLNYPSGPGVAVTVDSSYHNTLPSIDFSYELQDNLIARASYSKTIARADFGNLFAATSPGTPARATALGGIVPGSSSNPSLIPLESENIDISLEAYYADDSYISIGLFNKKVSNFIGTGQTTEQLFGIRDPSSAAAGTRSGAAASAITNLGIARNDVDLFVLTALIDHAPGANLAAKQASAEATIASHISGGVLDQTYADGIFALYDILPDSSDPLVNFEVTKPINQHQASIHGVEFAIQNFFGDTGFGVAASYTRVDGDVSIDVAADPSVDQFALQGLSNSANVTLIYEKYGFSGRLAYNWRDKFLQNANIGAGGVRNPLFVAPFEEIDLNVSYDITPSMVVSFDGINLTGENIRTFGRAESNYWLIQELEPRYELGLRYKFN